MESKKDMRITIRFLDEELDIIDKIVGSTGWTRSETLRRLIFDNVSKFKERTPNEQREIDKLLFYFNKVSNNMNQVAKTLNAAHSTEKLNDKTYLSCLNMLSKINDSFKYGLLLCDPKK